MNGSNITNTANSNWGIFARRLPGRVNAELAAVLIGCQTHDIAALVRAKLLRPLGTPEQNSVKYFSSAKLLADCEYVRWLDRVTRAISQSRKRPTQGSAKPAAVDELEADPG